MELCKKCFGRRKMTTFKSKKLSLFNPELKEWEARDVRSIMEGNGPIGLPHHLMRDEIEVDCPYCEGKGYTGEIEP